jgi:hypothetical protein
MCKQNLQGSSAGQTAIHGGKSQTQSHSQHLHMIPPSNTHNKASALQIVLSVRARFARKAMLSEEHILA